MMKLKMRALGGVALLVGTIGAFGLMSLYGGLTYHEGRHGTVAKSVPLREQPLQPPDVKQLHVPGVDPKLEALQDSWAEIKGHLPLMRKDLDASNYTSGSEGRSQETDSKLLQRLLRDDVFRKEQNVESFLHIAHVLEEHRNKELGIAQPQHQNQDVPSQASKEQQPEPEKTKPKGPRLDVHISEQILNELKAVVDKMAIVHGLKPKRKPTTLELYTKDSE